MSKTGLMTLCGATFHENGSPPLEAEAFFPLPRGDSKEKRV
jgi:hypothetical protein